MKTISSENNANGPERSWLQRALLLIGAAILLSLNACANQSGTMPWYERTPASATPMR